jgi:hypothetical protein
MIVKDNGDKFENAPTGTHLARCIGLIDIGTHRSEWKGQEIRRRQVIIKWELPSEFREDGQPFVVSEFYTRSLSEKAHLRHALVNWRGRDFTPQELQGFDLKNILQQPCQVSITAKDNGKIKVSGVAGVPKGVTVPAQVNPTLHFDLDFFDQTVFDGLTDGLKKLIADSEEYQAETGETSSMSEPLTDDDIPF